MTRRFSLKALTGLALLVLAAAAVLFRPGAPRLADAEARALYAAPLAPPQAGMRVFHLGHSLVGRDMPAMLAQLAGAGHSYDSQLGWGTPLRAHWEPGVAINGFDAENAHERYRDATGALSSGEYDAFVATEMVEIRDAIKYQNSAEYLARWAGLARRGNPAVRIYLYETWPRIDDPEGWLARLDKDLGRYWEDAILLRAIAADAARNPIYVIPAGQVFARFVRAVEGLGGLDGMAGKQDLFAIGDDGARDPIHLNDLGTYLVALTHYAVLYQQSPVGLPYDLRRADGSPAVAPSAQLARLMQETVWQVVTRYPKTGVPQAGS